MTDAGDEGLARARRELAAAELVARHGFSPQAVSRAAAEAALSSIGETRAKHSGVVGAFSQLIVRDRGLDDNAGRLLRSLFERRSQADYDLGEVPVAEAERAVADARITVDAVEGWLSGDA